MSEVTYNLRNLHTQKSIEGKQKMAAAWGIFSDLLDETDSETATYCLCAPEQTTVRW